MTGGEVARIAGNEEVGCGCFGTLDEAVIGFIVGDGEKTMRLDR